MADVAKQAGVHVTTVSLALRNHPSLPESTRQRIQSLAESMGYRPDPALRALVAYRNQARPRKDPETIAYLTHWNTRWGWKEAPAHADFHAGAESKAQQLGYRLEHFWMGEPGLTHQRMSNILYARGIKGVVLASHRREIDVPLQLDWEHFSAVKIDFFPHEPRLHNITNNQCAVIRLALRRVMESGYRRIGFLMHRGWDHSVDNAWTAGFLCEQEKLPLEDRVPMCLFPEASPRDAWMTENRADCPPPRGMYEVPGDMFAEWFHRHRPEVIISKGSFVLARLNEGGLAIPEDVAFVDLFLEQEDGRTAGVRQNHRIVGELAIEQLAGQLQQEKFGVPPVPTTTYVQGTWLPGASLPRRETAVQLACATDGSNET